MAWAAGRGDPARRAVTQAGTGVTGYRDSVLTAPRPDSEAPRCGGPAAAESAEHGRHYRDRARDSESEVLARQSLASA